MSVTKEMLGKFLISFDNFLDTKFNIAVIGGCVLTFYDIDHHTEDIDLVFLENPPKGVVDFINLYSEQNGIEIQYGTPERFQSVIMNEDMFDHSLKIDKFKTSILHSYNFKNLNIFMLKFRYYVLVKIEAGAHNPKHIQEALRLVKHFQLPAKELMHAYDEYKVYLESSPRVLSEFKFFMRDAYGINM